MSNNLSISCCLKLTNADSNISAVGQVTLFAKPSFGDTLDVSVQRCGLVNIRKTFIKRFNDKSILYCDGGYATDPELMYNVEEGLKITRLTEATVVKVKIGPEKLEITAEVSSAEFVEYTEIDLMVYDADVYSK